MSRLLIAVLVILTSMYRWQELAWPLIVLHDQSLFTVPILLVFAFFQRRFVEGVARSGLR